MTRVSVFGGLWWGKPGDAGMRGKAVAVLVFAEGRGRAGCWLLCMVRAAV